MRLPALCLLLFPLLSTTAIAAAPVPLDLVCTIVDPQFRSELNTKPAQIGQSSVKMSWQPASVGGSAPNRIYHSARLTAAFAFGGAHLFDRIATVFGGALEAHEQDAPSMFRNGGQKLYYSDKFQHTPADIAASVTPEGVYVSGISSISLFHSDGRSIRYSANIYTEQLAGDGFVNVSGQCQMTPK